MATVGNLKVDLGLDSAAFDVGIKSAGKGMDTLAKRAAVMGAAIAAAVTAAAGAFTAIVLKTSEAAKATGDMADMLGLNVEALQELRHAADRGGMGMQNFDVAMRRFIRRSAEAANGTGAAKGAFKELGIELRTTDGRLKDSEALLAEVADAMEGVQSPADKLRLAFQMFDTDGAKMVNVLAGGSEELERLREEARKLGIVLDEDTIRAAQRFQDNLDTLRKGAEAFANRLTSAALPAFVAITNAMINFSAHTGDIISALVEVARYAGVAVAGIAGFFAPAILSGLGAVSVAIGTTMVGAVRALTAAMLANPMGLLIAGISAAVAAAFIFRDEIKQIIGVDLIEVVTAAANRTIAVFEGAYNAVIDLWQNLPQAFSGIGKMAWNSFIAEFEKPALTVTIGGREFELLGGLNLSGLKAELSEGEEAVLGSAFAKFNDTVAEGRNYIGEWTAALGSAWNTAEGTRTSFDALANSLSDSSGDGGVAGAAKKTKEALSKLGDIGQQVSNKLADSFTDMLMAAIEGGKNLGDMIGSLIRDLGRMFIHQGFQALLGMGGGGLFGGLFSGIGKLFGFARGGTILPGGAGGIDSQLVMFRKSPNERVDITKPGQTLTSGDGPQKLEINVNVEGARGNMEIQQMVSVGVAQGLKTVEKNIGNLVTDWQMRNA
ncbi:hypothetical protein [Pelagibacterium sediminicola]|uniref:hypothetical protein n=1 Tax=Pelagibacterium sediminicola TaxID=2248761 RepID=UPI000E30DF66|nr:hypothetical protein [Pelagibacterium sediminicola]